MSLQKGINVPLVNQTFILMRLFTFTFLSLLIGWGYTAEYFDLFRNHRFVMVKNAGHNIFIEQPDTYIETIRNFLLEP